MTYEGRVEGGKVILDQPVELADGTRVRVEVARTVVRATGSAEDFSLSERLASVIGAAEGLFEDAAENLDHYLYGTAKQK